MESDINRKKFEVGSVVYFVDKFANREWEVWFGTVEEHYPSCICIQLYDYNRIRIINGIPENEFKTPSRWQKLPKYWSYDTQLIDVRVKNAWPERADTNRLFIYNPEDVAEAIKDKILVKVQDLAYGHYETEISAKDGWRVVYKYEYGEHHPSTTSVYWHEVYATYAEAKAVVDAHKAELERQANLSDYDWSVEQIDNTLGFWAHNHGISDDEKKRYRDWILSQDCVEDIEVRIHSGGLQWKYWKNQRWMDINL